MQSTTKDQGPSSSDLPIVGDLRRVADEIRVKIHLAGMDAKDAWAKLEPRLHEFERKAEAARDKLTDEVKAAGKELQQQMNEFLGRLGKG
ncbi:hypothetical protein [Paraliomyxa miuraensis]|uniref:hypothetical protein n=1 Tax=Paraliomyxa miuraensis TaxID=376150 RepID=UPI002257F1E9|nr:hypothetical protein [Paraliomyxa miuraensis]MCX4245268.1 hypothetical protein [Paraliomyxa miuraensis]